MNIRVIESISTEIVKLTKNKINYFYIFIICIAMILPIIGTEIIGDDTNKGYSYLLLSLQTLTNTILPLILLLFGSTIVSSEISSGIIRNILVLNPSRKHFLISKIAVSLMFQFIIMATAAIIGFIIGYLLFGFGDIVEDGFIIMEQYQFWITFFLSYSLLFITLFSAISLGVFISTISMNNINAVTISIGSYILLEVIKIKLHIANFIYSTYIEFPLNMLSELAEGFHPSWTPKIYNCLIVSMSWIFVSIFLSFLVIKKREFK